MRSRRWWPLACLAVLAAAGAAAGADPPATQPQDRDVQALAAKIDQHISAGWTRAQVKPAAPATDAEFLRRVTLQLAGRIPSVSEVRAFLRDTSPDKRRRAVERLLGGPRHVTHFTNVFRSWMLPEASASFQAGFLRPGFEAWLRKQFASGVTYDKMVRELLTTPVGPQQAPFGYGGATGQANPAGFYVAKDIKPENVAAATSRLFLGVRLECAQCHDHPFARWEKSQFWEYAAFFSGLKRQNQGDFAVAAQEAPEKREIALPGSERIVQARFLDGTEPKWKPREPTRKTLAEWVTSPKNPYFARATVNRVWEYLLGTGLVEPVDEMVGTETKPSHPELLDELARQFADHGFDLKFLIRAITASKTYQLSSVRTDKKQDDQHLFARMPLRGMSPEQLFDSVAEATGFKDGQPRGAPFIIAGGPGNPRDELLNKFNEQSGKATEFQSSILQALAMMNGKLIEDATSLENSETLLAVVDNPFMSTAERIETLYLAALSRMPKEKELSRMVKFVEAAAAEPPQGGSPDPQFAERQKQRQYNQGLADVFWTLLNSGEFLLSH
jgi:hypothetical protein